MTTLDWVIVALRVIVPTAVVLCFVPPATWLERRGAGLMQDRPGPNRVGPFGLIQPLADVLKLLFKEDVVVTQADKALYLLAPGIALFSAMMTFAVIPYGPPVQIGGRTIQLIGADISIGVLYFFAMTSLSVYGIVLAGWSSNNKFSLIGGIRSSAQIISYELAMTTAAAGVLLAAGSFRLTDVVTMQQGLWLGFIPKWSALPQFVGFLIFFTATFAETNRTPFDLAEADAELVAGYHTEYSSMKFAMFFMAEYANIVVSAALTTTLYLGGWSLPFYEPHGLFGVLASIAIFVAKIWALIWVFIWVRWTVPRFRYDQLMRLGWKIALPAALLNLFWVAFLVKVKVL